MKGIGAFFIEVFKGIWYTAKEVLSALGNAMWKCVTFQWGDVGAQFKRIPQAFTNYGKNCAKAFNDAYQSEVQAAEKKVAAQKASDAAEFVAIGDDINALPVDDSTPSPIAGALGGIGGASEKTDRIKNINVTIEKVIDSFTIETTNMQESKERIKDMVAEVLMSAINDINYAV